MRLSVPLQNGRVQWPPRQWLVAAVIGLAAFVAVAVSFGYAWLPALLAAGVPAFYLLHLSLQIIRRLFALVGRLEVAWLLILLATLSVDTLSTEQVFSGALQKAQLVRLALLTAALAALYPNLQRWIRGRPGGLFWGRLSGLYAIFIGIAILSTVWSEGRVATLGKSFELTMGLLTVMAVAAQPNASQSLRRLFFLTLMFVGALLSIILMGYVFNPSQFRSYILLKQNWILTGGPIPVASNAISRFGALLSTVALAYLLKRRRSLGERALAGTLFLYAATFPVLAEGRTGITALVISATVLVLLQRPVLGLIFSLPIVLLMTQNLEVLWEFFRRGQNFEQLSGLSGRVDWWRAGFEVLMQAPYTGYGFGVGGRVAFAQIQREGTSGLHNGFLETAVGVGLLGFAVWLAVFVSVMLGSAWHLTRGRQLEVFAVAITLCLATILSSGAGGWMSTELGLFFILMALLDVERARSQRDSCGAGPTNVRAIAEARFNEVE